MTIHLFAADGTAREFKMRTTDGTFGLHETAADWGLTHITSGKLACHGSRIKCVMALHRIGENPARFEDCHRDISVRQALAEAIAA